MDGAPDAKERERRYEKFHAVCFLQDRFVPAEFAEQVAWLRKRKAPEPSHLAIFRPHSPCTSEQPKCSVAGSVDQRFCGPRLFGPLMERSNSCARVGGHPDVVDPAERDRRSNRPSADGFLGARAGVFVVP